MRTWQRACKINVDMYKRFVRDWDIQQGVMIVMMNLIGLALMAGTDPIGNVSLHVVPNELVVFCVACTPG